MMTVFQMPADGYLKGVNVPVYEWGTGDQELTVSLHKLNYPYRADSTQYPPDVVDGNGWIGGYDMNDSGWVSIMGNEYTPGGTAGICNPGQSVAQLAVDPLADFDSYPPDSIHLNGQIWPDSVTSVTLTPANHPAYVDGGGNFWINTGDFGSEPFVATGTWIGILVRFTGTGGGDDDVTGFSYSEGDGLVDPWVSLKFYHDCTGTSGNGGWHIRHWIFNFELAVLLTGDRAPQILEWTPLLTTLSTANREVTATIIDDNPSGGSAGVDSALIYYSIDGQITWSTVMMMDNGDDTFTGVIPGQPPGTNIDWYIRAVDVNGQTSEITIQSYFIFEPINDFLVLVNYSLGTFFPPGWPLIPNAPVDYDVWNTFEYDLASADLFDHYRAVIELTGEIPAYVYIQEIGDFIDTGGHYLIAGDEWLQHEIFTCIVPPNLLIDNCYVDINYQFSGDQYGSSRIIPLEDNPISGTIASFLGDSLYLNYDPYHELGHSNWLDALAPSLGVSVAFYGVSGILDSTGIPTGNDTLPVGIYYETNNGSRIVAFTFDPLALNTSPSYHWVGMEPDGPLQSAMAWIADALTTNPESALGPKNFYLHPNYPNPFNPITTIRYELPEQTAVKLAVYDILGQEVAVLVQEQQAPGIREVKFDARNLASGIYFYR
ncbi:MAG: T9SS type A sorting domain-containing protein, partial [Fidelibacterota bacterium]